MKRLLMATIAIVSAAALAQTLSMAQENNAPRPVVEDVPPGGCMPIGLTASGEIVFPIQCKELIERHRAAAAGQNSEDKNAAKPPDNAAPGEAPDQKSTGSVPPPNKSSLRTKKSGDCTQNRTYDPSSRTYTGYDGRRRSCS
ncbi:BA14K family protein [Bradyrhizobium sp. BRP22]|uniref:BA14K family protein n=1 Tax=Bradyrhizobium sp. BRP22 TaxID=2793821 RepID=UPI001CD63B6E|nr:BA14K family protein [Bradyrhizobium sp. BRP22]MCA1454154.1 BA14K family protein [Bradyrhizobium sp. BRP22]